MHKPSVASRVYTTIFRHALPAADPSRPERNLRSPGCCRGFADEREILRTLRKKFYVHQLIDAGVLRLRRTAPGRLGFRLHADLASDLRTWIAIRSESGMVQDIAGASGCISGKTIPLLATRNDTLVRRHVSHFSSIFVAFSVEDAAVLRALGLPAITATGLAGLERRHENSYRQLLLECLNDGFDEPVECSVGGRIECAELTSVSARKELRNRWREEGSICSLVLVGWSPAIPSAAEPHQLADTVQRLGEIHEDGGESLRIWRQTDGSLKPLLRTVQRGRSQPIRDALEKSIAENCQRAIPAPPPRELPLAVLYNQLQYYGEVKDAPGLNAVRDQILRRYKERIIAPLRIQAETTNDFRKAFCQLELADLVELQRTVALENTIATTRNTRNSPDVLDKRTSDQFKLVDRILKLTEALRK